MKHNLKNRPKRVYSPKMGIIQAKKTVSKVEKWFAGFEKDLLEIKRQDEEILNSDLAKAMDDLLGKERNRGRWEGQLQVINEILGEKEEEKQDA